jgi:hypothetical protein
MNKFEELIERAKKAGIYGGVYFTGIQTDDGKHYIDPRTFRNKNGLYIVKPFCGINGYYHYVCPICREIHSHISSGGKTNAECCDFDGYFTSLKHPFHGILFSHLVIVDNDENGMEYIDQFNHTVTERD